MKCEKVKLSDVCDLIAGFAFKSKDFGDFEDKVIKIADIVPPRVEMNRLRGINLSNYNKDKLEKFIAKPGDYVLAMTGATIGKIGRIYEKSAYINQRVLLFHPHKEIDKDFLYYTICAKPFYNYIINFVDSETAQPNISATTIGKYELYLPPLNTQEKIASILQLLDMKIELNNAINNNLNEQMQALYKSWFVDYEPFNGIKPTNWALTDIYSVANVIYGAPFSSKMFNTEGLGKPIIRIRDLKEQEFVTYTTEVHPKGHLIQPGDIVVGMDGEFRPYIWGNEEAWLNQRVCIFENKQPKRKAFVLYTIKPLLNHIEQTQVATTVIHIGKKDYDSFEILLPDEGTLSKFDEITAPMIEQIVNNRLENKRLANLRDTLLPKLMSGELDVSDIDL